MGGDHAADGSSAFPSRADDAGRGQSEVVGVLIFTSIAVVLAAAVGQYVFGISIVQSPEQSVGPQASFEMTVESDDDLRIRHRSGDRIDTGEITVVADGFSKSSFGSVDGDGEWTASESITISGSDLDPGERLRILWESSTTDDSTVLLEYECDP